MTIGKIVVLRKVRMPFGANSLPRKLSGAGSFASSCAETETRGTGGILLATTPVPSVLATKSVGVAVAKA